MTIRLPEELENYIHARVRSGRFISDDEAIAEAVRRLRQSDQDQERQTANATVDVAESPAMTFKPIWEVADEIRKSIPAEEWAKLPVDGAAQLDHYLYGSPKRPTQ